MTPADSTPSSQPVNDAARRYHGLDMLRAALMALGIVLHTSLCYMKTPALGWLFKDADTSLVFDVLVVFIHIFLSPLFFIISGFFSALLLVKLGRHEFIRFRARRILLPLSIAWPLVFVGMHTAFNWANHGPSVREYFGTGTFIADLGFEHLWFLYYLCFFSALALTSARVPPWLDRGFVALLQSPWKLVPLVLVNWLLNVSSFAIAPPVAPMRMWPDVQSFTVYGLFFLFGWMLYRHRTFLTRLVERPQLTLVVAIPIFFAGLGSYVGLVGHFPRAALALGQLSSALVGWLLFLGSITLATRRTVPASPVAMYLARASYWIYLAHLPLVAWLAVALRDVQWPSLIKGPLVMGTVLGLLLLSYELFVRRTVIGAALNGRARKTDIARDS